MSISDEPLASKFRCARCDHRRARVERLALSGPGLFNLFEVQPHRYAFVSCARCGYTEVYGLHAAETRGDGATCSRPASLTR
jgi:predicted nucleic-acid-binding Zn-ribbon protein